ncbi:type III-A CRISPR-associated RAMP protein Csm4 [Fervidobacterium thailandense]|nr:type III-A CRISPR-associated RAMP protein Csm4 [Fervidobacterium thailandense]
MLRYKVKLKFFSPLYVGTRNQELNAPDIIIHSDTIFSAIVNMYSLIYGLKETQEFINAIKENDVFNCSSAFPFVGDKFFLPKPIGFKFGFTEPKKEKKIKFVDIDIVTKKRQASLKEVEDDEKIDKEKLVLFERPRVSLDRISLASNIYYAGGVKMHEEVGYWFFMDLSPEFEERVKTTIKVLGDEGIGGERTYGYGQFVPEFIEDNQQYSGNSFVLLSVFKPAESEIESLETKRYKIIKRGGYVYSPYSEILTNLRHPIYNVFAEGSVFEKPVKGELTLSFSSSVHPVYRNYRAYLLPCDV